MSNSMETIAGLKVVGCQSPPVWNDPMWECSARVFGPPPYPGLVWHKPCPEGEGHYFYTQKQMDNRQMSPQEGSGYPIGKKANYNHIVLISHYGAESATLGQVINPVSAVMDIVSEDEIKRKAGMIVLVNSSFPDPSRPNFKRNQLTLNDSALMFRWQPHHHIPGTFSFWRIRKETKTLIGLTTSGVATSTTKIMSMSSSHSIPSALSDVQRGDVLVGECDFDSNLTAVHIM